MSDGTLEDIVCTIDKDQLKIPKENSFKMENIFKVKTKQSNTDKNEDNEFKKERKEHNLMIIDKLKKGLIKLIISEKKQKN